MLLALINFFTARYQDLKPFVSSFLKSAVDDRVLSEEFLCAWYEGRAKLGKDSSLY